MIRGYYTTKEYQADYLRERQQAYQQAQTDSDLIREWLRKAMSFLGDGFVAWGATFYQHNDSSNEQLEQRQVFQ